MPVNKAEMCKEGLLEPGDYGLFEDWSDVNRSRDGYIRMRDGLVLVGEVQEVNDEENFYNDGAVPGLCLWIFSWRITRWSLIIGGSPSVRRTWSVIASLR